MLRLLTIALGGSFGALARYGLSSWAHARLDTTFPIGTAVVNGVGCLVIGFLGALIEYGDHFSPNTRFFLLTGLLGSFTTFSTFGYETLTLARAGSYGSALTNIVVNGGVGLAAVVAGWMAGRFCAA